MHILLPELKRGDVQGFHLDFESMITKCGKIELLAKEYGPNGIYRAVVKYGSVSKESCFFPAWSDPQKFVENVFEAIESVDLSTYPKQWSGLVEGVTKEGLKIKISINLNDLKITTAYSVCDQWKHGDLLKQYYKKL